MPEGLLGESKADGCSLDSDSELLIFVKSIFSIHFPQFRADFRNCTSMFSRIITGQHFDVRVKKIPIGSSTVKRNKLYDITELLFVASGTFNIFKNL